MATADLIAAPSTGAVAGAEEQLPVRTNTTNQSVAQQEQQQQQNDGPAPFDIVRTYRAMLASDPDLTMPMAAIESLIEVLHATPSSTAMETVEVVKKEKAKLIASSPNPLPILAGADLFEQFLLRSLRGQTAAGTSGGSTDRVLSFEETREHLLHNQQLFARRAKEARDSIAVWGSKRVVDGRVVLTVGGSRVVNKILLHAAATNPGKYFKVIYVLDGSPRSASSVAALREAGIEVETISPAKVAYVLSNQSQINVVLVGTEVVMLNGGVISRMGTCQLAYLTKQVPGSLKRFYVAAETHKIVRKTPLADPMVIQLGVNQKDISKFANLGIDSSSINDDVLAEENEVDYTKPELIDGIITEQGIKTPDQIWQLTEDYI
ncbi:hypothetical protein B0H63DRAFT_519773 [Podospora didyma]|uniref:Translation initiation factor eIF2B subunit alpha n=1 Tax=Podospora didyma TaxID=330526 RepID=A0AAE0U4W1_9PEZI|nr:hypothetical protein B0H63DRAFT_519773 [Podospora didyma]